MKTASEYVDINSLYVNLQAYWTRMAAKGTV
jgi:hypothetical protein